MGCRLKNNSNESETECFPKHAKGIIVFWADSVSGIMREKKKKKKKAPCYTPCERCHVCRISLIDHYVSQNLTL